VRIPTQIVHAFQFKSSSDSGPNRPLIRGKSSTDSGPLRRPRVLANRRVQMFASVVRDLVSVDHEKRRCDYCGAREAADAQDPRHPSTSRRAPHHLEGTLAQDLPSWIGAHCRAFEFFGGAAQLLVPDNPKTAVTRACRYEPELNRTYAEMAAHYGTVILPARPRKPRDRAKVESAVQVVERWVLAPLRHRTFFSLAELNQELAVLRDRLNDTPFQKLPGTRRTLFETLERPALRPLPPQRYELAQWRRARVNIDYHCEIERGYYSVPHQLVHEVVDVRLTLSTVELFSKGRRVASHARCTDLGQYRTNPEHRPASHRKHLEWNPGAGHAARAAGRPRPDLRGPAGPPGRSGVDAPAEPPAHPAAARGEAPVSHRLPGGHRLSSPARAGS